MTLVGVVGGGTMGAGIAEVVAGAGDEVMLLDRGPAEVAAALARIEKSTRRAVAAGKIDQQHADDLKARVKTTTSLTDLHDREIVIEALPEVESLKVELLCGLDKVIPSTAILASNTSSIPITRIAASTADPSRVVGVHFFNPVPIMPLIEIVAGLATSADTIETVTRYASDKLGKHTIHADDRGGFVVNALLVPFLVSAIRMLESKYATKEDIDAGMVKGCAHPMGPLKLSDTIGLDVVLDISQSLHSEFGDPAFSPPPLLRRMVDAGYLGRKSGRGFYSYTE